MVYQVLTNRAQMDHFLAKWEAHPVQFENRHAYLWKILDGYEHRPQLDARVHVGGAGGHLISGASHGLGGNMGGLPGIGDGNNGGTGGGINPGINPNFGGGGIGTSSVPEPTAIALLGPGILGVVLAAARHAKKARKGA
jgi:hypothetical protein